MLPVYTSVALFFRDLKALFLDSGMTVERSLGPTDVILKASESMYLRLQKTPIPDGAAIGFALGDDPELLAVAEVQAARCLPFRFEPNSEFSPGLHWVPNERLLFLAVSTSDSSVRKYRVQLRINAGTVEIQHQDHLNPQFQPNFADTGGPFIPAGA